MKVLQLFLSLHSNTSLLGRRVGCIQKYFKRNIFEGPTLISPEEQLPFFLKPRNIRFTSIDIDLEEDAFV